MVDVRVEGPAAERGEEILTPEVDCRPESAEVRDGDRCVPPPPPGLVDRPVEITGATEPRMAIDALDCGAGVCRADLEDANPPRRRDVVGGQVVLHDAVRRTLSSTSREGKEYRLRDDGALPTIVPRHRAAWLGGNGAVGFHDLREDAATAEISRAQVAQWIDAGVVLDTGDTVTRELVRRVVDEEVAGIGDLDRRDDARALSEQVAMADAVPAFPTLPADELVRA